jgi:sigma-E factor negative regulatory protein RseB
MTRVTLRCAAVACLCVLAAGQGWAQATAPVAKPLNEWLARVHDAARQTTYTGTFVVTTRSAMASAKIWHVCEGDQQLERVETLSGTPRATFRNNSQVITFFPDAKLAIAERRENLGLFPNLLKNDDSNIAEFYQLRTLGAQRFAGQDAEVVELLPKDAMRFGYRVWSDKRTGLLLQLQTLDTDGRVLEQSAFSELRFDAPLSRTALLQMMSSTQGYRVVDRAETQKAGAEADEWLWRKGVPGFVATGCFRRTVSAAPDASGRVAQALQCMFSDGLATVSVFAETFDSRRHASEGSSDRGGATRMLMRRMDDWWITSVGEVPLATLNLFAQSLERKK